MQSQPHLPHRLSHDVPRFTPNPSRSVLTRRSWLCAAASAVTAPRLWAAADAVLPLSTSLADELATALRREQPLMVMVSLEGCVFCRAVRNSHLAPMRAQQNIAVVQVNMRSEQPTRDVKGMAITHSDLIRSWAVKVAPTVLFLGRGGEEVAERLQGAYLPDFYGAYLDDRLALAQARVRTQRTG